jgi:hypothetical protein
MQTISTGDIHAAVRRLSQSNTGMDTLAAMLTWLDHCEGASLDYRNQEAALTLLRGVWGPLAGTTLDAIREATQ